MEAELEALDGINNVTVTFEATNATDGSVGPDQFGDIQSCFSEPLELLAMPGIGHFPQREAPQELSRRILAFFQR